MFKEKDVKGENNSPILFAWLENNSPIFFSL